MRHFAAALFDLDGVLVDTEPVYTGIWTDIEKAFPTGIDDFARVIKGNTLAQILERYFPDPAVSEKVCAMLDEREEAMAYPLFDGVLDFLATLQEAGIPAAIVTSSNDAKMERLFGREPQLRSFFSALVTDSSVTHSKPHPEPYLVGARMLGVDPAECLVFEDSFAGMASGRAAGATVVGVATTNPRESIAGKADVLVDSLGGLSYDALLGMLSEDDRSF